MSAKRKAILLRIPEDLWDELTRWARDELRSVNAQLEYVLREAVRRRKTGAPAPAEGSAFAEPSPGASPVRPASPINADLEPPDAADRQRGTHDAPPPPTAPTDA